MEKEITYHGSIPRSREAIRDMVIASAFIAMSFLMPNGIVEGDFASHLGGMALGVGVGWLVKSFITHTHKQAGN